MEKASRGHSTERRPPDVRVRAVLEVVEQIQQDHGVPLPPPDLEDALDRVTPAEQHLPFGGGQVLPPGDEEAHHGRTVRQPIPQDEVVEDPGGRALVQLPHGPRRLQQQRRQPRVEAGAPGERDQLRLQYGAAFDEIGESTSFRVLHHVCHVRPSGVDRPV
ncbi:hypothetical protein [Streptomyces californicus]|uniref:hypothetical protein n=1 Tax=Streptomyces californicus TaxID=67351 RepID=UPI00378EA02E